MGCDNELEAKRYSGKERDVDKDDGDNKEENQNNEAVEEVTMKVNTKKDQNGGHGMVRKSFDEMSEYVVDDHLENEEAREKEDDQKEDTQEEV